MTRQRPKEWRNGKEVAPKCESWQCDFHHDPLWQVRTGKPTVPEVLPMVNKLYRSHFTGCCLHIVLDDYNIEDGYVEFCIDGAVKIDHENCAILGGILLRMSNTQRLKLSMTSASQF